jgi:hypothetical protein
MGLENVFLSVLPIVESLARSTICSSTTFFSNSRSVQRARPLGGLEQARAIKVPKRVEVRDLNERTVVKLATERKHLTDIIKMVAYEAESDLLALLRPHYARVDQEGRTLLHELFAIAGDIRVSDSAQYHLGSAQLAASHACRSGSL